MERVHNFNAGPAVLPEEVMREAQADFFNYKGKGLSVMEMSTAVKTIKNHRPNLCKSKKHIRVSAMTMMFSFIQGGASMQFLMTPMNFAAEGKK